MKPDKFETAGVPGILALLMIAVGIFWLRHTLDYKPAADIAPQAVAPATPALPDPAPVPPTFDAAARKAAETNSLGVALLTADWCGACKRFERKILPSLKSAAEFGPPWLAIIDVDSQKDVADKLLGADNRIPQLVRFNATLSGNEIHVTPLDHLFAPKSTDEVHTFLNAPTPAASPAPTCSDPPCSPQRRGRFLFRKR